MKLPIIFDNDCLSSFLWIKRLDIINTLFPNQIYIPKTVYDELDKIKSPKYRFVFNDLKTQISKGNFYLRDIIIPSRESGEYFYLISMKNPKRIGRGEAAAIVIAKSLNGTLASNNLRDILPHVQKGKPPYVCTEDILYLSYQKKYISLNEACKIWNDMKSKRRMLPKYDFKEVIRRLKINNNEKYNKQGRYIKSIIR